MTIFEEKPPVESEENTTAQTQESKEEMPLVEERKARLDPEIQKLAKELGVQLEMVNGTGKDGKITESDIRRVAGDNSLEQRELQSGNEEE